MNILATLAGGRAGRTIVPTCVERVAFTTLSRYCLLIQLTEQAKGQTHSLLKLYTE
jgi:hypothetical protein